MLGKSTWQFVVPVMLSVNVSGCSGNSDWTLRGSLTPSAPVPIAQEEIAGQVVSDDGSVPTLQSPAIIAGPDGDDSCPFVSSRAVPETLPTDIVWAIDTSGSMFATFPAIQQALTDFSQKVSSAGIDAHIVLLAGAEGLCVPGPLGSGMCGPAPLPGLAAVDSNEPTLLHLDTPFASTQGMQTMLGNYDNFKHLLRPNALTHLVMTEDGAPPMTAQQVVDHLEGRATATLFGTAWDPGLRPGSWVFHGVICQDGIGAGTCLFALGDVPVTTLDLISQTGGLVRNLDDASFGSGLDPFADLLATLAERVIVGARVSCEYAIPALPGGATLNTDEVNVALIGDGGASTLLPQVPSAEDCEGREAWAYDDPQSPSRVTLCPAACQKAQGSTTGGIDVRFGCGTVTLY